MLCYNLVVYYDYAHRLDSEHPKKKDEPVCQRTRVIHTHIYMHTYVHMRNYHITDGLEYKGDTSTDA